LNEVKKRPSACGGHIDLSQVAIPLGPALVDCGGPTARGLDDIAEGPKRGSAKRDGEEFVTGQISLRQSTAAKVDILTVKAKKVPNKVVIVRVKTRALLSYDVDTFGSFAGSGRARAPQ
jgi:hypothetical protein